MKHFKELPPNQFDNLSNPMLTEDDPRFSVGDELVLSMEGHREQVIVTISSVNRDRVFKGWCYLGLTGIDGLPRTVGGGSGKDTEGQNGPGC